MTLRPWSASYVTILCLGLLCGLAFAQPGTTPVTAMPSVIAVPAPAQASDHFDAEAAANAYLALIPAEARAKSDAYFEGGYWLKRPPGLLANLTGFPAK